MKKIVLLAFVSLLFSMSTLGAQLVITVNASTTHHVYSGESIQDAINSAQSGDTIFVHAGTYYEHVTIGKSISLIGENEHNTIIDGNFTGTVVNVTANNVRITGFTIRRSYQFTPGYGIYVGEYSTNNISYNIITNNECGIWLFHSSNNIISRNNVTNNKKGIYCQKVSNNIISKNNAENNDYDGICIGYDSSDNLILENNITNNGGGIRLQADWGHNTISRNNIMNNTGKGIWIGYHKEYPNNIFYDNNIINNEYGVDITDSSNNVFYHNNFIDNRRQVGRISVSLGESWRNIWDNGYPSGGNYWSDYAGVDVKSGPNQDQPGSDGIGDSPYIIYGDIINQDNYPLMNPCTPSEHELVVFALTTPASITLGGSSLLNTTVTNQGSSDESNVEFLLLINGTIVDSITIPLLKAGNFHMLSYLWTPTVKGTYNVTAYVHPVSDETGAENNRKTKFITVWAVGVKAGYWIKYAYSYRESPETPYTEWIKVEFLSVEGTNVTMRGTIHLSDGTEQNETFTVDIANPRDGPHSLFHAPVFDTLSGFVIPANSTVGYTAWIGNTDGKPCARINPRPHLFTISGSRIEGETERTYVGTSRTVVYAEYPTYVIEYGPLTCYWDKQTGVLVEVCNTRSDGWTAKAIETNMWEAAPEEEVPFWMQWWLWTIVAVVIVALAGAVYFLKKRKPPTPTAPPLPTEGT